MDNDAALADSDFSGERWRNLHDIFAQLINTLLLLFRQYSRSIDSRCSIPSVRPWPLQYGDSEADYKKE